MPYKNLVLQVCVDKAEFFCRLRDFLCARNGTYADYSASGIGWTLHDSSYGVDEDNPALNDWFVAYSPGENGKEDLYVYFKWLSGYLTAKGYLYWNSSTHAGVQAYGSDYSFNLPETSASTYELSLYGSLDFFHFWETLAGTYDELQFFGKGINALYDSTPAVCADPLTSGSGVSITVDAVPSEWAVGRKLFIRDPAAVKIITIISINGTTITADLPNNFAAGSKLSADLPYISGDSSIDPGGTFMADHITGAPRVGSDLIALTVPQYHDPGDLNGEYLGVPVEQYSNNGNYLQLPYMWGVNSNGLTEKQIIPNSNCRYFKYYSGDHFAIEEV